MRGGFDLLKTWVPLSTRPTTLAYVTAPAQVTIPYGRNEVYVEGSGQPGTPDTINYSYIAQSYPYQATNYNYVAAVPAAYPYQATNYNYVAAVPQSYPYQATNYNYVAAVPQSYPYQATNYNYVAGSPATYPYQATNYNYVAGTPAAYPYQSYSPAYQNWTGYVYYHNVQPSPWPAVPPYDSGGPTSYISGSGPFPSPYSNQGPHYSQNITEYSPASITPVPAATNYNYVAATPATYPYQATNYNYVAATPAAYPYQATNYNYVAAAPATYPYQATNYNYVAAAPASYPYQATNYNYVAAVPAAYPYQATNYNYIAQSYPYQSTTTGPAGTAATVFGVSFPGGAASGGAAPYVSPTKIDYRNYPDNQTHSLTVPGGGITVKIY